MLRSPRLTGRMVAAFVLAGLPAVAHSASTIEVFANYSPTARTGTIMDIQYTSPSFAAYQANVMNALINGLSEGGPADSPTRFQPIERRIFSVYETTPTPFVSWLGDTSPDGAFAGELGTTIREALRVESDTAFSFADVSYRYQDDQGSDFTLSFADLGFRFSDRFVGRLADGTLVTTSTGSTAGDTAIDIVALYYLGLGFINAAAPPPTIAEFEASGMTPEEYFATVNALYVGDPYSFSNTYVLRVDGATLATERFAGSIVEAGAPVPEPASWAMMLAGFGLVGGALRSPWRRTAAA